MTHSERPDWLNRHLDELPAEAEPARDLWPGIEQRLRRAKGPGVRRGFRAAAMAASLLIGAGLALLGWQALSSAEAERAATAAMVAELLAPYRQIQAEQALRWQAVRADLEPALAATLEQDMERLAAARATLAEALTEAPTDATLHRLMGQVIVREAELIETGAHLVGVTL